MTIQPLPRDELRSEILYFRDGTALEINAQMRVENAKVYAETCKIAIRRRFAIAIDAKNPAKWPAKSAQK